MPSTLVRNIAFDYYDYADQYYDVIGDFTVTWREDDNSGRLNMTSFYLEAASVDGNELSAADLAAFRDANAERMERYAWSDIYCRLRYLLHP